MSSNQHEIRARIVARLALAEALLRGGERIGARRALLSAVAEAEVALGPGDLAVGRLHDALGVTAIAIGDLEEAAERLDRARAIAAEHPDDALLGAVEHHRGRLALELGRLATAEARTRRALALLADGDPLLTAGRAQLGSILSARGRHEEALALLVRAVAEVGACGLDVAMTHAQLGEALGRAGRPDDAEDAYRAGLAAWEGADHPDLVPLLLGLAGLADGRGEAHALAARAVGVLEGRVAGSHPGLTAARERLSATARREPSPARAGPSG